VTFHQASSPSKPEKSAWILLERVRTRTASNRAIGILQVRECCGRQQASDDLRDRFSRGGDDSDAARMIASIDADAEGTADPDARWD
jgi:hypothetical protein